MPRKGLIIDLRSNPGGVIDTAERLLQLFTTQPHRTGPLRAAEPRRPWSTSPKPTATAPTSPTGRPPPAPRSTSARSSPSTSPSATRTPATSSGAAYSGPVVAVVDANTFSCGDLFAAGIVDHGIGQIVSVGDATGAGGANVWTSDDIEYAYHAAGRHLPPIPPGISFSISVRRMIRTGQSAGLAIEDIGIVGDDQYEMTEQRPPARQHRPRRVLHPDPHQQVGAPPTHSRHRPSGAGRWRAPLLEPRVGRSVLRRRGRRSARRRRRRRRGATSRRRRPCADSRRPHAGRSLAVNSDCGSVYDGVGLVPLDPEPPPPAASATVAQTAAATSTATTTNHRLGRVGLVSLMHTSFLASVAGSRRPAGADDVAVSGPVGEGRARLGRAPLSWARRGAATAPCDGQSQRVVARALATSRQPVEPGEGEGGAERAGDGAGAGERGRQLALLDLRADRLADPAVDALQRRRRRRPRRTSRRSSRRPRAASSGPAARGRVRVLAVGRRCRDRAVCVPSATV